jgi:hypothetical protein
MFCIIWSFGILHFYELASASQLQQKPGGMMGNVAVVHEGGGYTSEILTHILSATFLLSSRQRTFRSKIIPYYFTSAAQETECRTRLIQLHAK